MKITFRRKRKKKPKRVACCRRSVRKTERNCRRWESSGEVKKWGRLGRVGSGEEHYATRPKLPSFFHSFATITLIIIITKRLEHTAIKADKKHMIDVISSSFAISGSVRNLSWHWFAIILYSLQLTQFPLNFYLSLSLSPPLSPPPPSLFGYCFLYWRAYFILRFYSLVTKKKDPGKWFHRPV